MSLRERSGEVANDAPPPNTPEVLEVILSEIKNLSENHSRLASSLDAVNGRVDGLAGLKKSESTTAEDDKAETLRETPKSPTPPATASPSPGPATSRAVSEKEVVKEQTPETTINRRPSSVSRIILTTYPGQSGINPFPMQWGHPDPMLRGPVVVSRNASTVRRRNGIGAHGGSYSTYLALAVASSEIKADHMPDFTNAVKRPRRTL